MEIVEDDLLWIIGLETLKNLKAQIHTNEKGSWIELGKLNNHKVNCLEDAKGHLKIELLPRVKQNPVKIWLGNFWIKDEKNWTTSGRRLHLQFGHANYEKLQQVIKESMTGEIDNPTLKKYLERLKETCENCTICKKYKRNSPKPVVGLPLSREFNGTIAVDIGELEGEKFIVIVDLATKYTQAAWVKNKKPQEIVKQIIRKWIVIFGPPKRILSDNGLEFNNEDMKNMTEGFGIEQICTASFSPWRNGICEKTVGILKESLRKLKEDGGSNKEIALDWTINARNTLNMSSGFSPHQLVFGKKPLLHHHRK